MPRPWARERRDAEGVEVASLSSALAKEAKARNNIISPVMASLIFLLYYVVIKITILTATTFLNYLSEHA
jgi:predicted secreted protein